MIKLGDRVVQTVILDKAVRVWQNKDLKEVRGNHAIIWMKKTLGPSGKICLRNAVLFLVAYRVPYYKGPVIHSSTS